MNKRGLCALEWETECEVIFIVNQTVYHLFSIKFFSEKSISLFITVTNFISYLFILVQITAHANVRGGAITSPHFSSKMYFIIAS